ncbi:MAG TPA: sensor histidine kinase [Ilumatobacteraceae bacterium]|nr:sensor histidine kinase [Ilumatobacteraceae bacterium]
MHHPHPIRWLRTHPRGADGLLAALVIAGALAAHLWGESTVDDPNEVDPAWWTVLLVLAGSAPVYWRRTHTLAAGLLVVAAETTALFVGISGAAFLGSVVAVYSIGAHTVGAGRTRATAAIGVLVLGLFVAGWIDGLSLLDEFISTGVVLVTAFVVGDNLRRRRQHVTDLAERAERAEREQGLLAEQRVAAERTRIARDLHDVVAHSVSVMVIQAAAARRSLDTDRAGAAQALGAIESTGRRTMTELRAILGVLRTDEGAVDAHRDPQPSLTHVDALLGGPDVDLVVIGDLDDLADSVSATGYRLVQEALTNVRRHGGPTATATVRLEVTDAVVVIEILDDGRGAGALGSVDGFGIVGMRERVAALSGTFEAGPRPGGGWRVHAEIPRITERTSERSGAATTR